MTLRIRSSNIEASTLSNLSQVKISTIVITDSSYNNLDDLAVDTAGGYIKITGTGFVSGCTVVVGTQTASAVSFVSSTEVRAQIPAQSAGTYPIYVVNPDGATAIRVNAINYSGVPTWTTTSPLPEGEDGGAISIQFEANSATSYSLAVGSTLPAGLTLSNVGLLSGTISGLEVDTTYNFTVVATDAELQDTPRAFSITITSGDPYLNQTSLLLQADVVPFNSDASANAFAITINGDTKPNNFNPYTPGYYSAYFDGTGDYLQTTGSDLAFGTGDFTIELWFNVNSVSNNGLLHLAASYFPSSVSGVAIYVASNNISMYCANTASAPGGIILVNTWNHVAVVRSSGVTRLYLNGTFSSAIGAVTDTTDYTGTALVIGGYYNNTLLTNGYISNLRIVKGTALYISNFTPPTEPLTAVTNTSLLACQSNRFIDTSTNNFAITRNGDTRISSFIPFTPSSSYLGRGSGYFDGTGDFLSTPGDTGLVLDGDFTIEFSLYLTSMTVAGVIGSNDGSFLSDAFAIIVNQNTHPNQIGIWDRQRASTTAIVQSVTELAIGEWYHIAFVRNSNTVKIHVNGVEEDAETFSNTITLNGGSTPQLNIGKYWGGNLNGYVSNLRVVKGAAVYTADFTPPTEPLTAVAGTSLLTLQTNQPNTNGVFLDSSTNNFLPTRAGDAAQSSFSPYGANWSNYFNGGTNRLTTATSSQFNLASSDITLECWIYVLAYPSGAENRLITIGPNAAQSSLKLGLGTDATVNVSVPFGSGGAIGSTSNAIALNTWLHIAFSLSSNTASLYINGTRVSQTSGWNITSSSSNYFYVGYDTTATVDAKFNGYVSNVRLVVGSALYTGATIEVPTTPLTAIVGTRYLGCQSNQFVDASANNFAITRVGDVRVERFGPFPATTVTPRYSVNFDGTGDYATIPYSASTVQWWDADYTIEMWIYNRTNGVSGQGLPLQIGYGEPTTNTTYWAFGTQATGVLYFYYFNGGTVTNAFSTTTVPLNTWTHVAMVYNNATGVLKGYISGTEVFSVAKSGTPQGPSGFTLNIGAVQNVAYNGYISNLRIVRGSMVYTGDFTPSTTPLTAVANTSLLTCQSDRLIDNSTNAFAITAVGDTRPTTFAPFAPVYTNKQSYATATYGGSVFVDGNGDYINLTSQTLLNLGTVNFTLECWFYDTGSSLNYPTLIGNVTGWTTGSFSLRYNNTGQAGKVSVHWNPAGDPFITSSGTFPSRCWHHVALTRFGTTFRLYVNGTLQATGTSSNAFNLSFGGTNVGWSAWDGAAGYYQGYITDVRLLSGTVLYPSAFVPPVAPLTAIPQTVLLYNNAASATADNTGSHIVRHVGNSQTSTVVTKYGTGSMYFDGSGDYLSIPNHPAFLFGSGDYTIEAWIYPTAAVGAPCIAGIWSVITAAKQAWMLYFDANGSLKLIIDPADTVVLSSPNSTIQLNTWQHVAVTKSGTAFKMFKDGVVVASATQSHTMQDGTGALEIGDVSDGGTHDYSGYIDDLRITKGYARYTANFTPPSRLQSK